MLCTERLWTSLCQTFVHRQLQRLWEALETVYWKRELKVARIFTRGNHAGKWINCNAYCYDQVGSGYLKQRQAFYKFFPELVVRKGTLPYKQCVWAGILSPTLCLPVLHTERSHSGSSSRNFGSCVAFRCTSVRWKFQRRVFPSFLLTVKERSLNPL